jgi:hypothetical protein
MGADMGATGEGSGEACGLSAGDFVLYIKAEQAGYLTGDKHFTLWADGYAKTTFTIRITEPVSA